MKQNKPANMMPKKITEEDICAKRAAREKAPVKKELDLGFTENSKDDIVKANQNVKKPIIGEPRKK